MITAFYYSFFYEPLYNGFVFLLEVLPFHDVGLSIIIFTLAVRIVLFPLSHKSVVTQRKMKEIEPEIKKIKERFKNDKSEQAKKTMELYRDHGISPFSSFLFLLIQLPVFIALFMILKQGVSFNSDFLYSFVSIPEAINIRFLGLVDMSLPNYGIAFLSAVSQFIQIKLSTPALKEKSPSDKSSFSGELQKSLNFQMKYIMPVFIFFIAMRFASGLALYWTVSNAFAIVHEIVVGKKAKQLSWTGRK